MRESTKCSNSPSTVKAFQALPYMLNKLRAQPISRILILVCMLVAVIPLSFLGGHLYSTAWDDSWREIREKHLLIANNMTAPIQTYVSNHRKMLGLISESASLFDEDTSNVQQLLDRTLASLKGFRSLVFLDLDGNIIAISHNKKEESDSAGYYKTEACFLNTRKTGLRTISKVKRDPISLIPTIYMGQPVVDEHGELQGVLLGELNLDYIEELRASVKFGNNGHSAIVDQTGQVIAHPNVEWMREIKDISDISVVKKMMSGEAGVTTFYSPFIKENMVVGYATVPEIGWGIMVPQPESEVAARVHSLMFSNLLWGLAGLVFAIFLALFMARWILRPLNKLAQASQEIVNNGLVGDFPEIKGNSPKEVRQLGSALQALVAGLQNSRDEVNELNASLLQRVDDATKKLLVSNKKLEDVARQDYLTELANRRYFENSLSQTLSRRTGDVANICVILIDIDHFKQINDTYGHHAGDRVLNKVARILENSMRTNDLVARYGGDEFVAYMRCEHDVGLSRAKEIRAAIDQVTVPWQDRSIHISASIGFYCQSIETQTEVDDILSQADDAMYLAKKEGRNRVVEINPNV